MALPTTRESLKQWCLRALGEPVIQVNVDVKQVEDRLDEALEYFQNYHFDAVEQLHLPHKITASQATLASGPTGAGFTQGDILTGATSSVTCTYYDMLNATTIRFTSPSGTFSAGEHISNGSVTAVLATPAAVVFGDVDNKYIPLTDAILSVSGLMKAGVSSFSMFDVKYQFALQYAGNLRNMDLVTYDIMQRHVALIEEEFRPNPPLRFNRLQNKLYIDFNWANVDIDSYFVVDCQRILDPADFPKIYGSRWLREYATELIRKQWGENISKYDGIDLPGGVKLNGTAIRELAVKNLERLQEQVRKEFQLPIDFLVG